LVFRQPAGAALAVAGARREDTAMMTMEIARHRAVIRRYFDEVWNQGRLEVLDQLLTADYVNHSPGMPNPPPGPAGLVPIVAHMRAALPDLRYQILDEIYDGRAAAVRVRLTATHQGELFGIPATGRSIDIEQMQIEHFRDGRICAHWRRSDDVALRAQLGV
jgi:steroid delta-isomerase-like uncharacterized protein